MCPGTWLLWGARPNRQCVFQSEPAGAPVTAAGIAWKDRPTPFPCLTLGMSQVDTRQFPSQAGHPWPRRVCFGLENKGGFGSELGIWAGRLLNAIHLSSAVLHCRVLSRTHLPPSSFLGASCPPGDLHN